VITRESRRRSLSTPEARRASSPRPWSGARNWRSSPTPWPSRRPSEGETATPYSSPAASWTTTTRRSPTIRSRPMGPSSHPTWQRRCWGISAPYPVRV